MSSHRILLAAAGAAAFAVLPAAAADATTVAVSSGGELLVAGDPNESSTLSLSEFERGRVLVADRRHGLRVIGAGCAPNGPEAATCTGVKAVRASMADGQDFVEADTLSPTRVEGGRDMDVFQVPAPRPGAGIRTFSGGTEFDEIRFRTRFEPATNTFAGVDASLDDLANDGVAGARDNALRDIEMLTGDEGPDVLRGDDDTDVLDGRFGNDQLVGNGGDDTFVEAGTAFDTKRSNGGDTFFGGAGIDRVRYSGRTQPLRVSIDNRADDGEGGERDNVLTDVEEVHGGDGSDVLIGSEGPNRLIGFDGDDAIDGAGGDDEVRGDRGRDWLSGGGGNDRVGAAEGDRNDVLSCGAGIDHLFRDTGEIVPRDCETNQVIAGIGTFGFAERGSAWTVRWRHHVSWDQLREVELHVLDRGRRVGRIVVDVQTGAARAAGAGVSLGSPTARVVAAGRAGRVRLDVRVAQRLAGRKLTVKLGATEDGGVRQAPRAAGTVG